MQELPVLLALLHPIHYLVQVASPLKPRIRPGHAITSRQLAYGLKRYQVHHSKILAIWALLNLVAGGTSMFFSEGESHQFHHMNAAWGSINLMVAGLLWYRIRHIGPWLPAAVLHVRRAKFRRFLLANIGLDLAFVAIGYWLHQQQSISVELQNLYRGFGNSVMIQGAGLLTLDLSTLLPYSNWLKQTQYPELEPHSDTHKPVR